MQHKSIIATRDILQKNLKLKTAFLINIKSYMYSWLLQEHVKDTLMECAAVVLLDIVLV